MMKNKKVFAIIIITIIILGLSISMFIISGSEVTMYTDKNNYTQGETIEITVRNGLYMPIFYHGGERFWGIEYFEDGKWINPAHEEDGGFQLTEEDLGDDCYIKYYERMEPSSMLPYVSMSNKWNQKICPFGSEGRFEPRTVEYIGCGKYRFIFYYGFQVSADDRFMLKEYKTAYSNNFTIN